MRVLHAPGREPRRPWPDRRHAASASIIRHQVRAGLGEHRHDPVCACRSRSRRPGSVSVAGVENTRQHVQLLDLVAAAFGLVFPRQAGGGLDGGDDDAQHIDRATQVFSCGNRAARSVAGVAGPRRRRCCRPGRPDRSPYRIALATGAGEIDDLLPFAARHRARWPDRPDRSGPPAGNVARERRWTVSPPTPESKDADGHARRLALAAVFVHGSHASGERLRSCHVTTAWGWPRVTATSTGDPPCNVVPSSLQPPPPASPRPSFRA
jgi:hypothetical protein